MTPGLDATLLSRVEDAGLNASAPPQQRWLDGWLVRFSPGKAKRARCINAVATGRMPVADKLALCRDFYRASGLPLYFRMTPFSMPADLDAVLHAAGLVRQDDTRVMLRTRLDDLSTAALPAGHRLDRLGHHGFADLVGGFRGSSLAERQAHGERLAQSPVPFEGFALVGPGGVPVACGQVATEAELVGLYDVFTVPTSRGRGLALALCAELLEFARRQGSRTAYLQVDADNAPARRVYQRLGFVDAYRYHYRTPAGARD
jgi:GNAT superfamily N-acetyltransferase